jgi:hypothetical protein
MKVNVKKLDETIAKLQELRRLATDPALAAFVAVTGRANANGTSHADTLSNGNGHGVLKASVLAACKSLSGTFTIKNVYAAMQAQGYQSTAESAEKSVANVLRTLTTSGEIRIAVAGKGRRATAYSNN